MTQRRAEAADLAGLARWAGEDTWTQPGPVRAGRGEFGDGPWGPGRPAAPAGFGAAVDNKPDRNHVARVLQGTGAAVVLRCEAGARLGAAGRRVAVLGRNPANARVAGFCASMGFGPRLPDRASGPFPLDGTGCERDPG